VVGWKEREKRKSSSWVFIVESGERMILEEWRIEVSGRFHSAGVAVHHGMFWKVMEDSIVRGWRCIMEGSGRSWNVVEAAGRFRPETERCRESAF
jgi:hypothetical protein